MSEKHATSPQAPAGPLAGIRIIDLTSMLSGPWATMILADQGADVIKVEEPRQGDHTRSYGNRRNGFSASFLNLNRNKRSVAIDLKTPQGVELREAARRRRRRARAELPPRRGRAARHRRGGDPRGGARHRLRLDQRLRREGPLRAQARLRSRSCRPSPASPRCRPAPTTSRPRLIRTVLPDKLTAVTAAQAIAAALVGRLKTGKGQHVRLSMLDAVLAFLWASDMGAQTYVGEKVSPRTAASFIDLIYETQNGFMTAAVMTNKEWAALTRALERPEWLEDPRFKTPALRDQNIDARLQMTQDVLKTRTTAGMAGAAGGGAGVPCAPVLTRDQVIAHPQIAGQRHPARERPPGCRPPAPDPHRRAVRHADRRAPRRAAPGRAHRRGAVASSASPPADIAALAEQGVIPALVAGIQRATSDRAT